MALEYKLVKVEDGKIIDEFPLCDEQLAFIKMMLDALDAAKKSGNGANVHIQDLNNDDFQAKIAQAKALGGEVEEVAPGLVICKVPRSPENEAAMEKAMSPGELNKYRWQK